MSVNFKCLYCDRYLSSRNAYSQHVKYCNELEELNTSTEESNNDISDTVSSINEMSLDSDDFSQIEELQSIREENLPPVSEISYQYESDSNYAGDVSLRSEEFENFDEILSESLQNYTEKSDTNMTIIKRRVTEKLYKTPTALIYTSKLFEFKLLEASIFFEQQKKNPDLTENMIKGFAKFLECLDLFFDMLDIISAEDCRIKIFGSVTLKNINILRATNKFQNRPWFSNIAIVMDDAELFEYQSDNGTCYAQTLLITEVILPNKSPFHLALMQCLLSDDLSKVYVKWNEMYILSRLEIFKESDLEKFQKAINDWANLFVILFRKKSDSKMKFPKFHSWIFHIVDTIREYGAINGYTTETYESLHKSYIKTPYRLSNKKDIEEQIMKTIRRKAIIKRRVTEKLYKTPTALIYTSKLFEFKLLEASIFFEQQKKNPDLTENMIKGFAKFLECLDLFFDMLDIISAEDCRIKIFGSVTLKNINILRATNKFQNRPWFSNIAIVMDDAELFEYQSDNGTCYAQGRDINVTGTLCLGTKPMNKTVLSVAMTRQHGLYELFDMAQQYQNCGEFENIVGLDITALAGPLLRKIIKLTIIFSGAAIPKLWGI
ncbi:hypothetical protein Glove_443g14 [Diversispora epigaea]|uniref:Uncharacterized protein n=1 Tax=Diversispora epigaea TaxID=1348612 RepID=A0A397GUG1_9GLOM|nr:hypothetical protein Glove_443g14 [Diversispora epigaea]